MREYRRKIVLFLLLFSISVIAAGVFFKIRSFQPESELKMTPQPTQDSSVVLKLKTPLQNEVMTPENRVSEKPDDLEKPDKKDALEDHSDKKSLVQQEVVKENSLKKNGAPQGNLTPESSNKNACLKVEYPGEGFQNTKVSREDWVQVTDQFHEAKRLLHGWLLKNHARFSDKNVTLMETQLQDLKIERPPSIEEPDLSWRGIGIWVQDNQGMPILRISGGFVKLVSHEPKRSLFEMTRLVAQSWAPCELKRVGADSPWNPLLKCLEVDQESACGAGSYSEEGWAVSSSLATELSPPGCTVPLFFNSQKNQCLQKMAQINPSLENTKPIESKKN